MLAYAQLLQALLQFFQVTKLGGIDTVAGAFAASIFYAFQPEIQRLVPIPSFTFIAVGLGAISLGRNPGGFAGQVSDAVERLRAFRAAAAERQRQLGGERAGAAVGRVAGDADPHPPFPPGPRATIARASSAAGRVASSVSTSPSSWWRNQVSCRFA